MLAHALALAALVAPPHFRPAPVPADTDTVVVAVEAAAEEAVEDVLRFRVRPVFSFGALYSPSKGVGIGGGIAVDRAFVRGDHLQVEARIAQHLQGAYLEYRTGSPERDRFYGLLGATGWTTTRTTFTGHGPHAPDDTRLFLDRATAQAEARLAWLPSGPGALLLQPTVRFHVDRLRGYEGRDSSGLAAADPADLARLDAIRGETRHGVEAALSAVHDTRDLPATPSRGLFLQGEVARFQATDGSGLGFLRVQATGFLFRPALFQIPFIPERGALFVRVAGVVTRQDGDEPLPWYYLPELSRDLLIGYPRSGFVGRDALSLGLGVRGVIGQAIGAILIEGVSMVTIGAAYDDVFREFTPVVRLSDGPVQVGDAVPLRPSLGIGLNLHTIDRERPLVGGLIGIGPGGFTFASLRLIFGLDEYRPHIY